MISKGSQPSTSTAPSSAATTAAAEPGTRMSEQTPPDAPSDTASKVAMACVGRGRKLVSPGLGERVASERTAGLWERQQFCATRPCRARSGLQARWADPRRSVPCPPGLACAAPTHLQHFRDALALLQRRAGRAALQPLDQRRHDSRHGAAQVPHARQIAAHEHKRARRLLVREGPIVSPGSRAAGPRSSRSRHRRCAPTP
jgi:hypothetical protein